MKPEHTHSWRTVTSYSDSLKGRIVVKQLCDSCGEHRRQSYTGRGLQLTPHLLSPAMPPEDALLKAKGPSAESRLPGVLNFITGFLAGIGFATFVFVVAISFTDICS